MKNQFHTIEELVADLKLGKMVILVDDEDRENEGDLVLAADFVTAPLINFMATEAKGLICLSLSSQQIDRLGLPLMIRDESNRAPNKTAFTVSIEAASGVSTGISAADRAHTIFVASRPGAKPTDVHMPGHIFPIRSQAGGVLRRAGHTEGSVDLMKLAGLNPAAVICEVMNPDGSMARVPDLFNFAKKHQLKIGTIVDLIEYRLSREVLVEEVLHRELPPEYFGFTAKVFRSTVDGVEHLVLQKGQVSIDSPTLVRIQVESQTREIFSQVKQGSTFMNRALSFLSKEKHGLFMLIRGTKSPGQDSLVADVNHFIDGKDPIMDQRDYGIGAQILRHLGVHQIRLMTSRFDKKIGIKAFGLEIVEIVSEFEG